MYFLARITRINTVFLVCVSIKYIRVIRAKKEVDAYFYTSTYYNNKV